VDGLQVVFDDVGVNLRGLDAGMAEHFLNVADAGSAAKHPSRASMAQAVRGRRGGQVAQLGVAAHEAQEPGRCERLAGLHQKQQRGGFAWLGLGDELRPGFAEVTGEPFKRDVADRNEPIFAAFALLHGDGAFVAVEVVEGELAQLTGAEAAGVKQLEHGAVADAFGAGGERGVDERVELRGAEDVTRQRFGFVQRWELRGGVGEDGTAIWKAPHFLAVGVGEGGACRWWAMGGAASFAKRWNWLPRRCRPERRDVAYWR